MAIDLSTYTRVFSDEFFDGYNAKNGKDVVLKPKNKGKLTFDGDVVVPASSVPGSITKDENGNVNFRGSHIFGVDPIFRKLYGEFNRTFDEGTSMTVPHAATKTPSQTYAGYIKLVYCGTEDSEGSITSAKFDDTDLTCDGTWREVIIPTADHGLIIQIEGAGTFSYVAEINESVFDVDDENDGE